EESTDDEEEQAGVVKKLRWRTQIGGLRSVPVTVPRRDDLAADANGRAKGRGRGRVRALVHSILTKVVEDALLQACAAQEVAWLLEGSPQEGSGASREDPGPQREVSGPSTEDTEHDSKGTASTGPNREGTRQNGSEQNGEAALALRHSAVSKGDHRLQQTGLQQVEGASSLTSDVSPPAHAVSLTAQSHGSTVHSHGAISRHRSYLRRKGDVVHNGAVGEATRAGAAGTGLPRAGNRAGAGAGVEGGSSIPGVAKLSQGGHGGMQALGGVGAGSGAGAGAGAGAGDVEEHMSVSSFDSLDVRMDDQDSADLMDAAFRSLRALGPYHHQATGSGAIGPAHHHHHHHHHHHRRHLPNGFLSSAFQSSGNPGQHLQQQPGPPFLLHHHPDPQNHAPPPPPPLAPPTPLGPDPASTAA
ncbi:unnamed protein product, partial [Discosporangium mesarthrocarpum]